MARKKKKKRSVPGANAAAPGGAAKKPAPAKRGDGQAIRETVESLAIAFVLAFLFRTFQAEAFVIPTGSMAPTLMGRHKDVECDECGQRFKVNSSNEALTDDELAARVPGNVTAQGRRQAVATVGGVCPTCRYPMSFHHNVQNEAAPVGETASDQRSHHGDRILVNKYLYQFREPERWDVVVFKYPGNANQNFIKRLVGLPNEDLLIAQGDLFVRPRGSGEPYTITRKSPSKMLAMRQLVHDTDRDSATLYKAGWPLRWGAGDTGGWEVKTETDGRRVDQSFRVDASGDDTAWLRYRHTPAPTDKWRAARQAPDELAELVAEGLAPELICDDNPYNSEITYAATRQPGGFAMDPKKVGMHWAGDLMLEVDIEVDKASGELSLDLVEAGQHFTCTFDLKTGQATLGIRRYETGDAVPGYSPSAATAVRGAGRYRLRFANFDDHLTLWVDGQVVEFEGGTGYAIQEVFGGRDSVLPKTGATDAGDLAPAGVGARGGVQASISRLQVWRDLYYIAADWRRTQNRRPGDVTLVTDFLYDRRGFVDTDNGQARVSRVCRDERFWSALEGRQQEEFTTGDDQFFVMGDNSAESSDCRLWKNSAGGGVPGGDYLERSLLIGKAVCVYWPHSWSRVPGTPIPFPLFPNFADMRLVR